MSGVQPEAAAAHNLYAQDVLVRLAEFTDARVPWHRALWLPSSTLALEELIEYGESLESKAIKPDQVKDAARFATSLIAKDLGIRDPSIASAITSILDAPAELAKEIVRNRLSRLIARAKETYLETWALELASTNTLTYGAERVARYLASFMLDEGISPDQISSTLPHGTDAAASQLSEFCHRGHELQNSSSRKLTVVVPLQQAPRLFLRSRTTESRQIAVLKDRQALDRAHPYAWPDNVRAGLAINVKARDPWAAVNNAREILSRLASRLAVSKMREPLLTHETVAVVGYNGTFLLDDGRSAIRIPALDRSAKTLQIAGYAEADALDDALELISSLGGGSSGAALTNGWAAIEGLLVSVGESGLLGAERLADIVTADWPRNELTWLANGDFDPDETDADLQLVLADRSTKALQARIDALEKALRTEAAVAFRRPRDIAALHRLQSLFADPRDALSEVRGGVSQALRRLYVQRNLVMHVGSFRSVARATTLRTVPPLAAAGMDRLVFAAGAGITPSMLAARAKVELDLVHVGSTSRPLHRLLD